MSLRLRPILRRLKANGIIFRPEKRPIIIFALRRGGSTMLADAIAGTPGVWFSNEPFAVLPAHGAFAFKSRMLPTVEHSQFFNLQGEDLKRFDAYLALLLRAGSAELGTCRKTLPVLRANRVLLKVLNAPWMIDHVARTTDAHVVVLLRHPAAQALSTLRQGWGWPQEAYFRRLREIAHLFSEDQIALWTRVAQGGNSWQIAILDWIIQSHPLRNWQGCGHRLLYEDIVRDRAGFVAGDVLDRLDVSDRDTVLRLLSAPSGSSGMSLADTRRKIAQGATGDLIDGWKRRMSPDMVEQADELLRVFGVTEYSMDV